MEVGFHSFFLEGERKLYTQSFRLFLLALGISLWGNVIVLAGPSTTIPVENDFRAPLSKRVLEPSKNWRTTKKEKNLWRESEENRLKIQEGRIKKKSSSLYGSINDREKWDPYSFSDNPSIHTTSPTNTILKFRF